MSLDKLKLSKGLVTAMTDAGYLTPKEIQLKTMSRIIGGQDIIAVGPEGAGKTTTYVLAVLSKLKYTKDDAPKVLILVADQERGDAVIEQFISLSRNRDLNIMGLLGTGGLESDVNELALGTDIVVATPTRARAVYLKLGLNLSKLQTFIVDDAAQIVSQGMQLPVAELARSAGKCQHLIFTEVVHDKLYKMIDQFMNFPALIEVEDFGDKAETVPQMLYHVPNYKTKLHLLHTLLRDDEVFDKVVVFVNSRLTAQKLVKSLESQKEGEYAMLKPLHFDESGFDDFGDFKEMPDARVLVVANEGCPELDLEGISFIFHFELPETKEVFLNRILKRPTTEEMVAITFSTDLELAQVRKLEQAIGQKFEQMELPEEVQIVTPPKSKKTDKNKYLSEDEDENPRGGGAYHQKKDSNSKNYNYGIGQKAKMTMKKKHS